MFYSVVGLHYVLIVALWIANGRQTCEGTEPSGVNSGLLLSDVRNSRIMLEENVSRHLSTAKYTTQRKADKEAVVPKSAKRGRHDKVQVEDKVAKSRDIKQESQEKVTKKLSTSLPKKNVILPTTGTTTVRPLNCSGCFDSEFPTLFDEPDLCRINGNNTIDIVFLIVSAIEHTSQRNAIRNTWASVTKNNTGNLRHVFMVGTTPNAERMRALEEEGRQFRDLVMSGFHDSYRNLTLKTMSSLRWMTTRCHRAR